MQHKDDVLPPQKLDATFFKRLITVGKKWWLDGSHEQRTDWWTRQVPALFWLWYTRILFTFPKAIAQYWLKAPRGLLTGLFILILGPVYLVLLATLWLIRFALRPFLVPSSVESVWIWSCIAAASAYILWLAGAPFSQDLTQVAGFLHDEGLPLGTLYGVMYNAVIVGLFRLAACLIWKLIIPRSLRAKMLERLSSFAEYADPVLSLQRLGTASRNGFNYVVAWVDWGWSGINWLIFGVLLWYPIFLPLMLLGRGLWLLISLPSIWLWRHAPAPVKKAVARLGDAACASGRLTAALARFISMRYLPDINYGAWTRLVILALFLIGVNYLNVLITGWYSGLMEELKQSHESAFWGILQMYLGAFVVGAPTIAAYHLCQKLLGLKWRAWLTRYYLKRYMGIEDGRERTLAYYRLNGIKVDNPDERIQADVGYFTTVATAFVLIIADSPATFFAFAPMLWHISPLLLAVALGYAYFGSAVTYWVGMRLVQMQYNQLRLEANFRRRIIDVRNAKKSIAFYAGEQSELGDLNARFQEAYDNQNAIWQWNFWLELTTKFYSYLNIVLPMIVVAPMYFAGKTIFGSIARSNAAFGQILGSLSIFVSSVSDIVAFAAGVNRLGGFDEALSDLNLALDSSSRIKLERTGTHFVLRDVTVKVPDGDRVLVQGINVEMKEGVNWLIVGASGSGKTTLFGAICGLDLNGSGTIIAPPTKDVMFTPQSLWFYDISLREVLLYPGPDRQVSDAEMVAVLKDVHLEHLVDPKNNPYGLDAHAQWNFVLSGGEKQRIAFARILLHRRKYALLDEATAAVDTPLEAELYRLIVRAKGHPERAWYPTVHHIGHRPELAFRSDMVLRLKDGKAEQLTAAQYYQEMQQVAEAGKAEASWAETT